MIWLWEREGQRLSYEMRRTAGAYELTITYPDGSEDSERFEEPSRLLERSFEWRDRLTGEGWTPLRPW